MPRTPATARAATAKTTAVLSPVALMTALEEAVMGFAAEETVLTLEAAALFLAALLTAALAAVAILSRIGLLAGIDGKDDLGGAVSRSSLGSRNSRDGVAVDGNTHGSGDACLRQDALDRAQLAVQVGNLIFSGVVIVLVSDNLADLLLQRAAIIDEDLQLGIIQAVDNSIETGQAVVGHLALDSGSLSDVLAAKAEVAKTQAITTPSRTATNFLKLFIGNILLSSKNIRASPYTIQEKG